MSSDEKSRSAVRRVRGTALFHRLCYTPVSLFFGFAALTGVYTFPATFEAPVGVLIVGTLLLALLGIGAIVMFVRSFRWGVNLGAGSVIVCSWWSSRRFRNAELAGAFDAGYIGGLSIVEIPFIRVISLRLKDGRVVECPITLGFRGRVERQVREINDYLRAGQGE